MNINDSKDELGVCNTLYPWIKSFINLIKNKLMHFYNDMADNMYQDVLSCHPQCPYLDKCPGKVV